MKYSKAQVLDFLKGNLICAKILDLYFFTVNDWKNKKEKCLEEVLAVFPMVSSFIVRSSSRQEDQFHSSNAGKFKSILNVTPQELSESIDHVVDSYGESVNYLDEILIQPMLIHVMASGVLFSKDPNHGANYYIINYDTSGCTHAITGGGINDSSKVLVVARCASKVSDLKIKKLIKLVSELEQKLKHDNLDIEFAFDSKGDLYLFQVRPLIIKNYPIKINQDSLIQKMKNKFENLNIKHPYLCGKRTILAVMPDWNPAEIIGVRPKPLALSLYKELVTDSTWAYQRDNYGYKNLRSFPLLIDLMGLPYIDVRVSFNSFIPKELNPAIAEKLVNYYLYRLESDPFLHDKIEFEVVFSCYTFDLPSRIQVLKEHKFNQMEIKEIENSLRNLTNNIIHSNRGLWIKDIEKIEELKKRYDTIFSNNNFDYLTKIYWLMEDCKRYGTLPFAGLARAGFIAVQLLNSMVSIGILTNQESLLFLNSLESVSTTMTKDMNVLDRGQFLAKYGHLRPGTYDILSLRYDEAPDLYFDWKEIRKSNLGKKEEFKLTLNQMKKIEILLNEHGLDHDIVGLLDFIKSAIEGREYSKFIFTKNLSCILSLLKNFARENNFKLEDMSYVDIQKILKLYSSSWDLCEELKCLIDLGKKKYNITKQLNLPSVIIRSQDMECFYLPDQKPNFITMQSVTARTVTNLSNIPSLKGNIAFIHSADPGFDWIFTHGISGFVTAYGGVNSHMAIRAGELGLPAVIGAGEKFYNAWKKANVIHIDCANQRVEILH